MFYLCHNFSITYFFYTFIEAFSIDGDISKTDKIDNNVIHVPQIVIMVIWSYEKKNNSREQMINFPVRDGGDTNKDLDYYYATFGIHTRTFSTLLTIETNIR